MAPVATPFDAETGEVAPVVLRQVCRSLLAAGLEGLVVAGSTGEGELLDEAERIQLVEWLRDVVPDDRWLIAGTDYLTMLDVFDPRHPFLGDRVKAWIDQAQTRWDPNNKGGWYSLGVNTSAAVGRWQVGHGGMLNSLGKDPAGRRTAAIVGSNAYRRSDGTAVFVALSPVVGGSPELAQLGPEVERLLRTTPAPVGMLPLNLILLLN